MLGKPTLPRCIPYFSRFFSNLDFIILRIRFECTDVVLRAFWADKINYSMLACRGPGAGPGHASFEIPWEPQENHENFRTSMDLEPSLLDLAFIVYYLSSSKCILAKPRSLLTSPVPGTLQYLAQAWIPKFCSRVKLRNGLRAKGCIDAILTQLSWIKVG